MGNSDESEERGREKIQAGLNPLLSGIKHEFQAFFGQLAWEATADSSNRTIVGINESSQPAECCDP